MQTQAWWWLAAALGVLLAGGFWGTWMLRRIAAQQAQQQQLQFQVLANQILEEKGRTFAHTSQESLSALLQPLRQQIEGFQQRVNQVHDQTQRGQVELSGEIRRMLEAGLRMHDEAQTLSRALKGDKKLAGSWGEAKLILHNWNT